MSSILMVVGPVGAVVPIIGVGVVPLAAGAMWALGRPPPPCSRVETKLEQGCGRKGGGVGNYKKSAQMRLATRSS